MQTATTKQQKPTPTSNAIMLGGSDTTKSIPQMEREEALRQALLLNMAFKNKNPQAATA